ncbi:shikimate kinase [Sulfuriroseicoccus oceanibius]|uniref:Shikimate kinase n=1 Tax=Sulfuriroseicoccus oceanibius TaxID=2707525 RepID=A0A7T7F1K4_9BACT|nr:shikimate kinase [Sulfuriroseicoccus oceanibius]QQL45063.1 shikimate kinase [Sulfuriroseicoccus oceanibius]
MPPSTDDSTASAPDGSGDTVASPRPLNIVLVGFMATGKTTIGRILSKKLGFQFVDCDHEIEKQQGMKITEIFKTQGEEAFRQMETDFLQSLASQSKLIISTGGGVVGRQPNREILPTLGYVVWLHTKKQVIFDRVMSNSNRPLVQTEDPMGTIKALLKVRKPLYKEVADIQIKTHKLTFDETAEGIIDTACYFFSKQQAECNPICEVSQGGGKGE